MPDGRTRRDERRVKFSCARKASEGVPQATEGSTRQVLSLRFLKGKIEAIFGGRGPRTDPIWAGNSTFEGRNRLRVNLGF